jgi:hypothetical protein
MRREFLAFCFSVDGNNYKWHQPVEMVTFDYSAPSEAQFIDPAELAAEKPIALKRHQLATAKALIEWVITQQEAPQKGAG